MVWLSVFHHTFLPTLQLVILIMMVIDNIKCLERGDALCFHRVCCLHAIVHGQLSASVHSRVIYSADIRDQLVSQHIDLLSRLQKGGQGVVSCWIVRSGIKTDAGCHQLTIKVPLYTVYMYSYKCCFIATSSALKAGRCACRTWCKLVNQRNASRPASHPTQEDAASLWPWNKSLGTGE